MRTLAVLFLCLGTLFIQAQSLFVNSYGNPGSQEEARAITRSHDGNYVIAGYRTATYSNKVMRMGHLLKIDKNGNVLWSKLYTGAKGGLNYGDEFYDIILLNGYYYCVGATTCYSNAQPHDPTKNDVLLMKIDVNGTVIWARNYGSPVESTGLLGNDIGVGIVPNFIGGVMISIRINSGNGTNQNTGMISVDSDGMVRWANQYDLDVNGNTNELAWQLWRADHQSYVLGGWYNDFLSTPAGLIFKVTKDGDVVSWAKRTDWGTSSGLFESMYSGYYDFIKKVHYTTDFYNPGSNSTVRSINVMTHNTEDGTVPSGTAMKSIHFPTASLNNHRSNLFPAGDGTDNMVIASYKNVPFASGVTNLASLTYISTNLADPVLWQRDVGFQASHNKIVDMIPCDENSNEMIGVGTVQNKDGMNILVARVSMGVNSTCMSSVNRITTNPTETATTIPLTVFNLNQPNCGNNCWADNDNIFIEKINDNALVKLACGSSTGGAPIVNKITLQDIAQPGGRKLNFVFDSQPDQLAFEVATPSGEIIYNRVIDNVVPLTTGINVTTTDGYSSGTYHWRVMAKYPGIEEIEVKEGSVTVQ